MKKTIKLAVVAALALGTTSAFATNGSEMIATGAKATGMAGAVISVSQGAESALSNPALITSVESNEISFGGTLFMPNVKADMGAGYSKSDANKFVIPEVSLATKVNDNFYWGIGVWGTAGMGTDYRAASGYTANMNMVTNLQLMQFGVPLAYKTDGLSVAVTPILQYGALDINYVNNSTNVGAGVAQDLETGYNLGLAYENSGVTVGAVYKSQIDMKYKGQMSGATQPFVTMGIFPAAMGDTLSTPAEMGAGISYKMEGNTFAVDYKTIKWSDAKGYKDFGWQDQNVLAVGYQYQAKGWALRLGYNHAKSPIKDAGAKTLAQGGNTYSNYAGNAINMFNLLGFPAIVETHYAVGGSVDISKTTSVDLAYTYSPESSQTLATMPNMTALSDMSTTVKHSQNALSAQLTYKF